MKFDIKNRWMDEVTFTAEIDCAEGASSSVKVGLSVKWAIKNKVYLREADLVGADLGRADLRGANLGEADLRGAKNTDLTFAQTSITPDGELIGWKKLYGGVICKLRIPENAKRSNATGRKCRAEFAIVLDGNGVSQYDNTFVYEVGNTVYPRTPFSDDRWDECAPGIHFFLTKVEAENY